MRWRAATVTILALGLGLSVWLAVSPSAGGESGTPPTRSTRRERDQTAPPRSLQDKLAEIQTNHQTILAQLERILEELRIIKVRASQ
mgnify:CR=1 FL=1